MVLNALKSLKDLLLCCVRPKRSKKTTDKRKFIETPTSSGGISSSFRDAVENRVETKSLVQKCGSLMSENNEYQILEFLGEGGFGKVMKCLMKESRETVAVKTGKYDPHVYENECSILRKLSLHNPDKFNFVRNLENFIYNDRFFMVFEMLDRSLYGYMEENGFQPLPMEGIRYITKQLLNAQVKLKELRIVHGDLKPENIMFVNHKLQPFKVKIIDFGLSMMMPALRYSVELGTLTYRAPEISLGMIYKEPVDMWSTGCIVVEMLTGQVLYPGNSPYDQMRFVDDMQGPFPDWMLDSGVMTGLYFCRDTTVSYLGQWCLKSPAEYYRDTGVLFTDHRTLSLENLDELLEVCLYARRGYDEEEQDRMYCIDMINEMLLIDYKYRMHPREALDCDFIRNGVVSSDLF